MFVALTQFISRILNFFKALFNYRNKEVILQIKKPTAIERFLLRIENKFAGSYDNKKVDWNENIDVSDTDKDTLEAKWKSRIMTHHTPRGNVLMLYDIYKQGFTYYSDNSGIPYSILNAMAMVYVLRFRCRDFFVDEAKIPEGNTSSLINKIRLTEEVELSQKKKFVKKLVLDSKSPFAKLKNRDTIKEDVQTTKMSNRFIYCGKLQNFRFTNRTDTGTGTGTLQTKCDLSATYKSHKKKFNHLDNLNNLCTLAPLDHLVPLDNYVQSDNFDSTSFDTA